MTCCMSLVTTTFVAQKSVMVSKGRSDLREALFDVLRDSGWKLNSLSIFARWMFPKMVVPPNHPF